MIRSITGLISAHAENSVVVLVHGIGYLVYTTTNRYPYTIGDTITLHTHLAVRETALDLYGFPKSIELRYFELLLTVPKIGPKSALQIMSQANPDLLASAILLQDADQLHKIAGIGKKTAQNIVTHLAGKIDPSITPITTELPGQNQLSSAQIDAIDALITLGYEQKEAQSYVLKLDTSLDAKTLIQSVLRQIPMA